MVESTWATVEMPILETVYEMERTDPKLIFQPVRDAQSENLEQTLATIRLIENGYLKGSVQRAGDGTPYVVMASGLTERGLREVQAWPSPEAAGEEFLAGLQRLIDSTSDPAERTRLEKLKGTAGEVGKAGLSTVIAAAVRGSLGLP